jgi:hypothetical protein
MLRKYPALKIRFLYYEDCMSHDDALRRLHKCVKAEGINAEIEIIKVKTAEEAVKLQFPGSPTIVVNGHDIDPPLNPHYALTCRAYRLEDGRISPLPSEAMIRKALRSAKER